MGGVKAGEYAEFNFNGNSYLYIIGTAAEAAPTATDSLIQLTGAAHLTGLSNGLITF